jgi:radical SAM superfamily enzyme YgiQ (UPF0313 family)
MAKARWDLLRPGRYMMPSIQTIAGCPENCSFCSVWVTEGRKPRQRLAGKVIAEANELYNLGYRYIVFADDNFNPATKARIARESSPATRKYLEQLREDRLRFFDEYHRNVPPNLYAFTQMTAELLEDEEYLAAMRDKMRIRTALIGVESFSEAGLESANKQWNPSGMKMVETIRAIQDRGILVLASFICGLESDTVASLQSLRRFAVDCGPALAQFTIYSPYPGTKDFHEMMRDRDNAANPLYTPKHKTRIVREQFWLDPGRRVHTVEFGNLKSEEVLRENAGCWREFYSAAAILCRLRSGVGKNWPAGGKLAYFILCLVFKRVYSEHGVSADSVQRGKTSIFTKALIKTGVAVYGTFFRRRRIPFKVEV